MIDDFFPLNEVIKCDLEDYLDNYFNEYIGITSYTPMKVIPKGNKIVVNIPNFINSENYQTIEMTIKTKSSFSEKELEHLEAFLTKKFNSFLIIKELLRVYEISLYKKKEKSENKKLNYIRIIKSLPSEDQNKILKDLLMSLEKERYNHLDTLIQSCHSFYSKLTAFLENNKIVVKVLLIAKNNINFDEIDIFLSENNFHELFAIDDLYYKEYKSSSHIEKWTKHNTPIVLLDSDPFPSMLIEDWERFKKVLIE